MGKGSRCIRGSCSIIDRPVRETVAVYGASSFSLFRFKIIEFIVLIVLCAHFEVIWMRAS